MEKLDLQALGLRALNKKLQSQTDETNQKDWEIINPRGSHAIAVGVDAPINVMVRGSTGYYCGGMNKQAHIHVDGSAGPGVAENMMSGTVTTHNQIARLRHKGTHMTNIAMYNNVDTLHRNATT